MIWSEFYFAYDVCFVLGILFFYFFVVMFVSFVFGRGREAELV